MCLEGGVLCLPSGRRGRCDMALLAPLLLLVLVVDPAPALHWLWVNLE